MPLAVPVEVRALGSNVTVIAGELQRILGFIIFEPDNTSSESLFDVESLFTCNWMLDPCKLAQRSGARLSESLMTSCTYEPRGRAFHYLLAYDRI